MDWLGSLVGWVLGLSIVLYARHQFRTHPALVRRRNVHRNMLGSGALLVLFACLAWFGAVAAATSGDRADRYDSVMFAGVGLSLAVGGAALLATWWRRAGEQTRRMD